MTKSPPLLPVVLAGFTAFLSLYATQPMLPLFQDVFGASHFAVSLTVTATTAAVALAAPFVGRLADAWGKRRVIVTAAFALAAATLLASTAATLNQVIVWRFVQGLVTPGVFAVDGRVHPRSLASVAGRDGDGRLRQRHGRRRIRRAASRPASSRRPRAGARASWRSAAMSLACAVALWSGLRGERRSGQPRRQPVRARLAGRAPDQP